MRGLLVFAVVFAALPIAVVFPFVGVLLWEWISFMNPHREAYGMASSFSFNFYIAVVTIAAWLFSSEAKGLPNQVLPGLMIAFALFVSLTTFFALDHESAYLFWDVHIKTLALTLVVMGLVNSRVRIQAFLWVMAISIGYFAVKGAAFMLFTGSVGSRILGPEHSMIRDNNNLGLAMVMTLPVLNYLRLTSANVYVRWATLISLLLTVVAIVGTYSRGGFVGLIVVGFAFLLLSKHKVPALVTALAVAVGIGWFAPQEWKNRMITIQTYESDSSAKGRLEAWETAWNLAVDRPIIGGGFAAIEQKDAFYRYRPGRHAEHARAPHSIYFQVLGDHGFVGILLYLAIVFAAVANAFRVQSLTRGHPDLEWANVLSRMLLIGYAGFLMAGSFLSMAYYDVFLCLCALSVSLREIVRKHLDEAVAEEPDLVPAGTVTASTGK